MYAIENYCWRSYISGLCPAEALELAKGCLNCDDSYRRFFYTLLDNVLTGYCRFLCVSVVVELGRVRICTK